MKGEGHRPPDLSEGGLAKQLSFYLANENVPGMEIVAALDKVIQEARLTRKIGKTAEEELDDDKLKKSTRMLAKSVLLTANVTPTWEVSSRAVDDILEARGI